jgi:hypothetical protein
MPLSLLPANITMAEAICYPALLNAALALIDQRTHYG